MIKKYWLEFILAALFIAIGLRLNLQFIIGSNINKTIAGHDEYIAVKEVYSILHPVSFKHFVMAVISGNALYYGRIMFYVDALVAFIPFKIWGISGMIMAIRMFHVLCIAASIILLGLTFLESSKQKLIFYTATLCLYFTMYYIMMPKPEPLQLLVLTIFLRQFKTSNWSFGRHFILLGIAYGLKFNVLLMLPLVFVLPLIKHLKLDLKSNIKPGLFSMVYFIIGVIVAIPCLILSPIRPIFLRTYLHETFEGTKKGYDDAQITFFDWMDSGLGGSYLGVGFLSYLLLGFALFLLFENIKKSFKTQNFSSSILLIIGLTLTTIIMLKTKRLWPHYLWTGYIFLFLGVVASLPLNVSSIKNKIKYFLVLFMLLNTVFFYFKRELPIYLNLSQKEEIKTNNKWSLQMFEYIEKKYTGKKIGTDGSILYPFSQFVEVDIYNPFSTSVKESSNTKYQWYWDFPTKIWENSDVVAFYKRHPEKLIKEKSKYQIGNPKEISNYFHQMVPSVFELDTVIGEIFIYKRK